STGRTGTKFLADYFNSHPEITATHEPKPSRILRMWSMAYLEGKVSDSYMLNVLRAKRKNIISQLDTPVYLESNPYLIGFAGLLPKVFKDPVIIHVVRDPRDFARSSINHGNSVGLKWFFNNYVPYWYPRVHKILGINKPQRMEHRAAAYWKIANQHLAEVGQKSSNYHVIRFEDIFDGKRSGLKKIEKILGIKMSSNDTSAVNKSKRSIISGWNDWSTEECRTVNELCQPTMQRFGYGAESEWKKRLKT
ncbi:MAG TPA: sulfotransferase, partial [Candidatus Saccharimonadales bacterium]|nr:sulfotransferase [Candidatus Saccharimonadales bacterium]